MATLAPVKPITTPLMPGDWVVVRTPDEIAATLDADGKLDGLPFMDEMLSLCGRHFRVFRRAEKACVVNGSTSLRRMENAVHLEGVRCTGASHDGCQAACLLFWKEAWLRPVASPQEDSPLPPSIVVMPTLISRQRTPSGETRYVCQSTELHGATCHLPWHDASQYARDVQSKNFGVGTILRGFAATLHGRFEQLRRRCWGLRGRTPTERLGLRPGELVEVKSRAEIDATLDHRGHNRGLWWDPEMYQHCGKRLRVLKTLDRVIDEGTGRMRHLTQPTVVLEEVVCSGVYHRFCSRSNYVYWREVWLRRLDEAPTA